MSTRTDEKTTENYLQEIKDAANSASRPRIPNELCEAITLLSLVILQAVTNDTKLSSHQVSAVCGQLGAFYYYGYSQGRKDAIKSN